MSNNGTQRVKRKYDDEFKRDALKMIDNGQTVRSVAGSLGIGENLLHTAVGSRRGDRGRADWSRRTSSCGAE